MTKRLLTALAISLVGLSSTVASAAIAVDVNKTTGRSTSSTTIASPAFSTAAGNELLLAFVATDGAATGSTTVTAVAGGGLAWALVARANAQAGTSEIWRAFAPATLANATVTATLSRSVAASITLVSFTGVDTSGTNGSGAIGAVGSRSAASGAPSVSLVTTRNNSLVFGIGNDWDSAKARTPATGQSLVSQFLASTGDTFWVQQQAVPVAASGTTISINDTAPLDDRFNLAACEILPAAAVGPTWSISGSVTPAAIGSGTTLTTSGAATVADANGNYTLTGLVSGSYTVAAAKTGFAFVPPTQAVTINGASLAAVNFSGQAVITLTVAISQPASGSEVSALTTVAASVSDSGSTVTSLQFLVDNVPIGSPLTSQPYSVPWDTTGTQDGSHVLTATAHDAAGNVTTSSPVSVTVGNDFASTGQWSAPFDLGIVAVNAALMHTGKVLLYSGSFEGSWVERVWDPNTGSLTLVPNPYYDLFCSGFSQLADGRILTVGGYDSATLGAKNANIFDPITQTWSAVPNMTYRRWYPTATTLPDGRVLVTSGAQTCLTCLADLPEVFDPTTNQFSVLTSARLAVPYYPFMYVLPDGSVIDAGANEETVATSKLDVASGIWTTVDPIVKDGHSSAMYLPGKILKTGTAADSGTSGTAAATAFVLDTTQPNPAWRQVASMANPRAFQNTTLLPDGTVLVSGGGTTLDGYNLSNGVLAAELWTPATETWRTLSSAAFSRLYHSTALLLPDGRVLSAGGGNDFGATDITQAQIFSPPYLFKGARPTITNAPDNLQYGAAFTVQTPDVASIASVALIRLGAVTHAFDEDQRFVPLTFTTSTGALTVQAPANANLAPPGYYMLFIVNGGGVPSIAPFVHFDPPGGDTIAPTAPTNLSGQGGIGSATLTWTASTDNTGVALYTIYRSTTAGFQPLPANRVGQSTSTSYADQGVLAGANYYLVTAQDVAQNVSNPSNEAAVTVFADTTPPTITLTAPTQTTISGVTAVSANTSDNVAVAGVQFQLDGNALGAERTALPYSLSWDSSTTSNGPHTLSAIARDAAGNKAQASLDVTVSNTTSTQSGLVAAYSFNEGSGVQTHDSSGQNNTGTIAGATWTASGRYGAALSFNGTNAWVTVADANSLDLTNGLTIEAWVNPTIGSGWRSVVMKETSGGLAYALYSANSSSRPEGYVHTSSDMGVAGTSAVALNTWTHLALTYDGTTLRIYANGVLVKSTAVAGVAATSASPLRIGGDSVWGEYFKGLIDEVRVYNRPLSAAEIQLDMTTPVP